MIPNLLLVFLCCLVSRCDVDLRRSRLAACAYAWLHPLPATSASSSSPLSSSNEWYEVVSELALEMGLHVPNDLRLAAPPASLPPYQLRQIVVTALTEAVRELVKSHSTFAFPSLQSHDWYTHNNMVMTL
jgi:hypothetical protein